MLYGKPAVKEDKKKSKKRGKRNNGSSRTGKQMFGERHVTKRRRK